MHVSSLVVPRSVTITVAAWMFPCPKISSAKYSSRSSLNSTSLSFSENRQNKDTQRASLPLAAPFRNSLAAGFNLLRFSHHCCLPDSSRMAHQSLLGAFKDLYSPDIQTLPHSSHKQQNKTNKQKQFQRPKTHEVVFYYKQKPHFLVPIAVFVLFPASVIKYSDWRNFWRGELFWPTVQRIIYSVKISTQQNSEAVVRLHAQSGNKEVWMHEYSLSSLCPLCIA